MIKNRRVEYQTNVDQTPGPSATASPTSSLPIARLEANLGSRVVINNGKVEYQTNVDRKGPSATASPTSSLPIARLEANLGSRVVIKNGKVEYQTNVDRTGPSATASPTSSIPITARQAQARASTSSPLVRASVQSRSSGYGQAPSRSLQIGRTTAALSSSSPSKSLHTGGSQLQAGARSNAEN